MLRSPFLFLLLIVGLATGCPPVGGGDDDDSAGDDDDATGDDDDSAGDDDDSAGDDDDATFAVFAPEEGDYDHGLINFSQNECAASQSNIDSARVSALVFRSDHELVSASWDATVRRWDLRPVRADIATLRADVAGWGLDLDAVLGTTR